MDSLAHPTVSGLWLGRSIASDFDALASALDRNGYIGACAIGLDNVEGYSHRKFISLCHEFPSLVPIAGFCPSSDSNLSAMQELRAMGFKGIKIHPRFSGIANDLESLAHAFRAAGEAELTVFYCTYMHCSVLSGPTKDPLFSLVKLLQQAPLTRVVLVHGGDVQILRYAELVRFNDNLLLDLSLTMMKYEGSSIDLDLQFLFQNFDRRICIGSDWPEYTHGEVRSRFEYFARGLPLDKVRNIGYRNLLKFLCLEHKSDRFQFEL